MRRTKNPIGRWRDFTGRRNDGCLVDSQVGFDKDARNPVLNQHINPVQLIYSVTQDPAALPALLSLLLNLEAQYCTQS